MEGVSKAAAVAVSQSGAQEVPKFPAPFAPFVPPPMIIPPGPPDEPPGPPLELLAAVDEAMARAEEPPGPPDTPMPFMGPFKEWETHKSPEGMAYFFCRKTNESRWVKPDGPNDIVVEQDKPPGDSPAPGSMKDRIGEPESWETIGKTGWSRVQTDKGFTYFYHKKQKKTSWTCPPEIERDVAELDGCLAPEPVEEEKPAVVEAPEAEEQTLSKAEKRAQQVEEQQKIAKDKEKIRNFKQLLIEKGVKGFDKYEKWLPRLVHDPRFTAIAVQKDRNLNRIKYRRSRDTAQVVSKVCFQRVLFRV